MFYALYTAEPVLTGIDNLLDSSAHQSATYSYIENNLPQSVPSSMWCSY